MKIKLGAYGAIAASRGIMMALALTVSGCSASLVGEGLGGPTVTRVDMSELPGPDGQVGEGQAYHYAIGPFDKLVIDVLGVTD